ncbi:MAG TPA: nitroreductase/quinone reductase family protein [Acidimicrobiales bacterium]|jgi:deazaflavin-dependent oxidoreductase (nitroreductase family)|nr:nitroreductase/quinone reductase family protein [Acidimicrobiales bacterium]
MGNQDRTIEAGAWALEHGHRLLLALTGGRFPKSVMGMQPVELHTVGRTTGERRSTMLTAPIHEPGRVVLVASKGGHTDHPGWYKNLAKTPAVELTIDGATKPFIAHTAMAEERAELWPRIVAAYKGYDGYQRNTDREIPVVVCEPA